MKKEWTPEERQAAGERLKAARAAKKTAEPVKEPEVTLVDEVKDGVSEPGLAELIQHVKELEAQINAQKSLQTPQMNARGTLVGMYEKYNLDPNYYNDPTDRLAQEPRLQRFAFPMNYELQWSVTDSQYQTIDGIHTKEPKFTLDLIKIVMDEDTGDPTNGRYLIKKIVLHEDPTAALVVARDNGVDISSLGERAFLDEMRYLRMRDWLLESFYPRPATNVKNKKEMVVGNRLVEYYEISSPEAQTIPFDQLSKKL